MSIQIAIDIGGTFTDVVAREDDTVYTTKVPTTPADLIGGVRNGIEEVISETRGERGNVDRFVHGTTAGTNAIIEREGGTVGLLMTDGFRDSLAIGRQKREDMYDLFLDSQTPTFLAPRERRVGIPERVGSEGEVLTPLDEEAVLSATERLVSEYDVDAIGVCYLFSFLNDEHEARTGELIAEHFPDLHVSLSSEINPKFREYERVVVTAFDAYLRPVIETYVSRMTECLEDEGIGCELQIMQSRGGITGADLILDKPVGTVLSGPAAAVAGASEIGARANETDLITIDIGGTSSDVSLIEDGSPHISSEGTVQQYPLRMQMVDISAIGSGGGSIAWLDDAGSLHVGPESAGADPGPACYGRGGREPTVTDASVILGYLNPEYFADGSLALDPEAAKQAVRSSIAEPLEYDLLEAAIGIHEIVNTKMAQQLRLTTVQRGFDPRNFSLFAMGGAGPVHAGRLAEEMAVPRFIIPRTPGVLSASGLLSADIEHDHETTFVRTLSTADPAEIERLYDDLSNRGKAAMEREDVPIDEVEVTFEADMRYSGQSFEIDLKLPSDRKFTDDVLSDVRDAFHTRHEEVYGHQNSEDPVEFVNLRVVNSYTPERIDLSTSSTETRLEDARKGTRTAAFVGEADPVETPVYDRSRLPVHVDFYGPAIIEQSDTTTVVYPGQHCTVDEQSNLVVETSHVDR